MKSIKNNSNSLVKDVDLEALLNIIDKKEKITVSYIQQTLMCGYNKAGVIYNALIKRGYLDCNGKVLDKT